LASASTRAALDLARYIRYNRDDPAGIAAKRRALEDAHVEDAVAALKRNITRPQQRSIIASAFGLAEVD
jgi:hypothetical protein